MNEEAHNPAFNSEICEVDISISQLPHPSTSASYTVKVDLHHALSRGPTIETSSKKSRRLTVTYISITPLYHSSVAMAFLTVPKIQAEQVKRINNLINRRHE